MEWIDGIKLTDGVGLKMAGLHRKKLIDQVLGTDGSTYLCSGSFS